MAQHNDMGTKGKDVTVCLLAGSCPDGKGKGLQYKVAEVLAH